jgi:hypothetical protein
MMNVQQDVGRQIEWQTLKLNRETAQNRQGCLGHNPRPQIVLGIGEVIDT